MLRNSFKQLAPKQIKSFGVIHQNSVAPVHTWPWDPFCTQFAELQYSPTLGLRKARHMEPAMQVFAKLDIDRKSLNNGFGPVEQGIQNIVNSMGYPKNLADALQRPPSLSRSQSSEVAKKRLHMLKERQLIISRVGTFGSRLVNAARQNALIESTGTDATNPFVEPSGWAILNLCGLDSSPLRYNYAQKPSFNVFGKQCSASVDQYFVITEPEDWIVIRDEETFAQQGFVGEIIGELLCALFRNRERNVFRPVFAIRLIENHLTCFRLDPPPKKDLDTLFNTRQLPKEKLKLLCSVNDPTCNRGLSLIDKSERQDAVRLMANIRQAVLK
jgi:hypothetical protein